jgi:hypothetical protein
MSTVLNQSDVFATYSGLPDVGIALIDIKGKVLRASSYFMAMIHAQEDKASSINYFELMVPEDQYKEQELFAKLLDETEQSYIQENRVHLGHLTAGHYDGVLHVTCQVMRYGEGGHIFFLVLMDELKVYRHFKKSWVEK